MLGMFTRRASRLEVAVTTAVGHLLTGFTRHLETRLERMEKKMSALTEAIASLTAAEQAEHEELVLVLAAFKEFPAKLQAAIEDALAKGANPEDLAAIQAVKDQSVADQQAMADALAAPPEPPA